MDHLQALTGRSTDRLRLGLVKMMLDNSIQGFSGRLRWPGYFKHPTATGQATPNSIWVTAPAQFEADFETYHRAGLQIHTHTNGDEASLAAIDAIDRVLALLRVLDSQPPFDAVVVEASAVSDPWRIAQYALADPRLSLQAVIVLVDAAALAHQAVDPLRTDTLARQLAHADLVVLNKADLAAADGAATPGHEPPHGVMAAARAWVAQQAPGVPVLCTVQADLPVDLLADLTHTPLYAPRGGLAARPAVHDARFMAWSDRPVGHFDLARLRTWLRAQPTGVLRLKAMLPVAAGQAASDGVELQFAGRHGLLRRLPEAPHEGAVVVAIGLAGRLPIRAIADGLVACARTHLPVAASPPAAHT